MNVELTVRVLMADHENPLSMVGDPGSAMQLACSLRVDGEPRGALVVVPLEVGDALGIRPGSRIRLEVLP